jgi:pimeloyl-ACP methyl ester carboxylesterase
VTAEPTTEFFAGAGGAQLAVHRLGTGRPVLLLHGLFSSAEVNWIKFGTAAKLAAAGFAAIMPDLRAHGQSAAPHEPEAYPSDVLVKDVQAVVHALALTGMTPRRLVLGGMGLSGLAGWARRSAHFIDAIDRFGTIPRGDPAFLAQAFMKTMHIDRVAARLLLQSVDDTPAEALAAITMPTLVVCGADDHDNGSATELAETLPDARYAEVPGNHMSSVTKPEFGDAIVGFLQD